MEVPRRAAGLTQGCKPVRKIESSADASRDGHIPCLPLLVSLATNRREQSADKTPAVALAKPSNVSNPARAFKILGLSGNY